MTVTVPHRTTKQVFDALAAANENRLYRAQLKRDIASGKEDWREVLRSDDPRLRTMRVRDLLMAIPMVGPKKVAAMMDRAGASDSKTIGGLSGRQRDALCADRPLVGRPTRQQRRQERDAARAVKDAHRYREEARELRREVDSLSRQLDAMYRTVEQMNTRPGLREVAA